MFTNNPTYAHSLMKKITCLILAVLTVSSCSEDIVLSNYEQQDSNKGTRAIPQGVEKLYKEQTNQYNMIYSLILFDKSKQRYSISLTKKEVIELGVSEDKYIFVNEVVSQMNRHIIKSKND